MMVRSGQKPVSLGGMKITIIGPTAKHLAELRTKWKQWLDANTKALAGIRETAVKEEKRLGTGELGRLLLAIKLQAEAFGQPETITPENLASLMLLVEQNGRSILLTGDARWDQLIEGLESTGHLSDGGVLTVDVLKVPHHGSRNNIVDTDLLDRIVATDYVFCGNGGHGNPHPEVVKLMARHRLKAPGAFKFWFNSSQAVQGNAKTGQAMADIEKVARQLAKTSKDRMKVEFLESGSSLKIQ
jgi:beta-lactamase superfamily II metal-dependent hydrolase